VKEALKGLFRSIGRLIHGEIATTPGRINLVGMTLSVFLVASMSLTPFFEAAVRILRPEVKLETPLLGLFITFAAFTLACAVMVAYLEPRTSDHETPAPEKATADKQQPEESRPADLADT
jgi:hypothetical protein